MKIRLPFALSLLLLGVLALGTAACGGASDAEESSAKKGKDAKQEPEAVPVEVATVERGPIEQVLRFATHLEAEREVAVTAEASRKVVELRAEEGARVGKGQVLARLQDDEQRTRMAKVESQLAKARREFERKERLFAEQLISEQAHSDARYELEQLELALEESRRDLSYTEVRAPISGTVTRRMINLGDFVNVNQELFHLVDFGSLVARVYVPEKELGRLADGQTARLIAPALGGAAFAGRIDRRAPVVDPASGTVKVTVAIPDPGDLMPGLYVDVELVTDVARDAVLLPKRALVYDEDQIFVYRIGAGLKAERVFVTPRREDKMAIEPTGGVAAGDRVVVAGQAGLKDGVVVRLVGAGAPAAAPAAEPAAEAAK